MPKLLIPHAPNDFLLYTLSLPKKLRQPATIAIYVHGFASDQRGAKTQYFKKQFLAQGIAYLSFDHRGHGKSSGTLKDLTISRNIEDLDLIIRTLTQNFKRKILIGSSMGGQTGAWYAYKFPKQVSANLFIAPGFNFARSTLAKLPAREQKRLKEKGEAIIKNDWIEVTIGRELVKDSKAYAWEKLVKQYNTPTLILHGMEDDVALAKDSVRFHRRNNARPSELVLIAGGDHRLTGHRETLYSYMHAFCQRLNLL